MRGGVLSVLGIFRVREFILFLALVIGFVANDWSFLTKPLVFPALGLALLLSTMDIPDHYLLNPKRLFSGFLVGAGLNYGIYGAAFLVIALFFPRGSFQQDGLILIALAPPAVAVVPFTVLLEGAQELSLSGTIGGNLTALFLFPFMAVVFWKTGNVNVTTLIPTVFLLIFLPLGLSRIVRRLPGLAGVRKVRGTVINWSFFLVIYTIVGLNRDYLLHHFDLLPLLFGICVAFTFGTCWIISLMAKNRNVNPKTTASVVLLSTLKNYGIASGVALQFFPPKTALPPMVGTITMVLYFIWLSFNRRRRGYV